MKVLLIDDDNESPDVRPFYVAALNNLGYSYDVFEVGVGSENGPSAAQMSQYDVVIWFSGDKHGGGAPSAGPNAQDETELETYLLNGGGLFLSSQDYLSDMGATYFAVNFLGVNSFNADLNYPPIYGQANDPVGGYFGEKS